MSFHEELEEIRETIRRHGDNLNNEEMTKQSLILPMIQAWGYDTRNPSEVMAEYPVALRKGSRGRADYVIMHNGQPGIVVECKWLGVVLDPKIQNQMQQYARALGAFAGIVTDGETYICFADPGDSRSSDLQFIRQVNVSTPAERDEAVLEMFSKSELSRDAMNTEAQSVESSFRQEDDYLAVLNAIGVTAEVVRIGQIEDAEQRNVEVENTLAKMEQMTREAVRRVSAGEVEFPQVVTTNDELDSFLLCKGMLHGIIEPDRITYRDAKTYFSVLIDDNNRKPLCRFHFNGRVKYIGTFDADKKETRHAIEDVDDLLKHARTLRRTAKRYAGVKGLLT